MNENQTPLNKYIVSYGGKEIFSSYTKQEAWEFMQRYEPPLSDRELFLRVMRGEWEPEDKDSHGIYIVNKQGEVWKETQGGYFQEQKKGGCKFAPTKELAETLSQVITGRYRPTQQDIDERVPFWTWDGNDKVIPLNGKPYRSYAHSYSKFFFSESQRNTFARLQEEKPDGYKANRAYFEEEKREERFFWAEDGKILFSRHWKDNPTLENAECAFSENAMFELNRIRTELNRLSQRFPKE